ncbi:hypothetical protein HBZC1_p0630 (plasmid) [Helicobacter bizzozeronii CIII-1]|uniref:Beta-lactamase n=1 Tax=Helicobacter bizzozeronii (strain CIII-1) TaxID=1002804 RepID=F8KUK8_HELBC|nr:hypothetical protein [Helicobacter bizzozeronii]CCB80943.1 hypothetical protein HBZC1_p0630 [Helicobacter bizzozeronii CIII-1]
MFEKDSDQYFCIAREACKKQDYEKTLKFLKKAAELGHSDACSILEFMNTTY